MESWGSTKSFEQPKYLKVTKDTLKKLYIRIKISEDSAKVCLSLNKPDYSYLILNIEDFDNSKNYSLFIINQKDFKIVDSEESFLYSSYLYKNKEIFYVFDNIIPDEFEKDYISISPSKIKKHLNLDVLSYTEPKFKNFKFVEETTMEKNKKNKNITKIKSINDLKKYIKNLNFYYFNKSITKAKDFNAYSLIKSLNDMLNKNVESIEYSFPSFENNYKYFTLFDNKNKYIINKNNISDYIIKNIKRSFVISHFEEEYIYNVYYKKITIFLNDKKYNFFVLSEDFNDDMLKTNYSKSNIIQL